MAPSFFIKCLNCNNDLSDRWDELALEGFCSEHCKKRHRGKIPVHLRRAKKGAPHEARTNALSRPSGPMPESGDR